jgi:hypothetical protein
MRPLVAKAVLPYPAERWRDLLVSNDHSAHSPHLTEHAALALAEEAVARAGGARMVYRNPRHPFSPHPTNTFEIDGHKIEVRWGEISSPAIVSVGGYVFEIHEEELELLVRPPSARTGS